MSPSTNQSSNNEDQAGPGPLEAAFSNRADDYPAGFPYSQLVNFAANTDIAHSDLENLFANVLDDFYACYNEQDSAIADEEQDSIAPNDNELDSINPQDEQDSTYPNDDEQDSITHHSELGSNTPHDNGLDSITHNHDELDSVITKDEQDSTAPRTNELDSITPHDNELASLTPRADELALLASTRGELGSAIPNGGEQDVTFYEQEQIGQAFQPANVTEQDQFAAFDQDLHGYATGTAEQGVASSEQEQGNTPNEHEKYGQAFQQPVEYGDWQSHIDSTFACNYDSHLNAEFNRIFNSNYRLNFDNRWAPSPPPATCHMSDVYNPIINLDESTSSHQPSHQPSNIMHNSGPQAWYQSNQINPADHMSTAAGPAPDWPQVQLPAVANSPSVDRYEPDMGRDESSAGEHDDDYDDNSSSSSSDGDDDGMGGDGPALAVSGRPTYGGKRANIQYDGQGKVVNRQPTPPPRETRSPRTRKEKKEKKDKKGKKKASASASKPATRSSAANPRGDAEDGRPDTQRDDQRYQARRGQAWSAAERTALEDAMRWVLDAHPRATVTERWELASDRMAASSGVFRGPNAVKIQWGRKGRQDSGVDERRNPKPHRMTTSDQKAGARSCAESKAVAASGDAGRRADAEKKAEKEKKKEELQQQRKRRRVVVDEDEDEEETPPRPLIKRRRASPVLTQSPPPGDVDMREAAVVEDLPGAAGAAGEGVPAPDTQAQEAADAALARLLQQEEVAKTRPRRSRRG